MDTYLLSWTWLLFFLPCSSPASLSAVLNLVSKYHSCLIQISLLYRSLSFFSCGFCFASSIIFYVYPSSSVLISLLLFLHSLPDKFLHLATCSLFPSCCSFTGCVVPLYCFLLSVYRFYFFCMKCRGLVFACKLDALLLSWNWTVIAGLYMDSLVLPLLAGQDAHILAYWRNRANCSFSEICVTWMNLGRFS